MKYLTEVKAPLQDSEIQYLDFAYGEPDKSNGMTPMGLQLKKQQISVSQELSEDKLEDEFFYKLMRAGYLNVAEASLTDKFTINYEFLDSTEKLLAARTLLSRIISGGSLIATQSRLGPGRIVIVNSKIEKVLNEFEDFKNMKEMAGLKFFVNDKVGNNILVLRNGEFREDTVDVGFYLFRAGRATAIHGVGTRAYLTVATLKIEN